MKNDDDRPAGGGVVAAGFDRSRIPWHRDGLGRFVREAWVGWAREQADPKPSWLVPYDDLAEADKEADRRIGETVAMMTIAGMDMNRGVDPTEDRRILQGLVARDPWVWLGQLGAWTCAHCTAIRPPAFSRDHRPGCPWEAAWQIVHGPQNANRPAPG